METFLFSIAGIAIKVRSHSKRADVFFDASFRHFSVEQSEKPQICIYLDTESPPPSSVSLKRLFTATPGGLWTILEKTDQQGYIITLQDVENDPLPYKTVEVNSDFSDFHIYQRTVAERLLAPLEYPLDELIVSGHININNIGILLHSAAVMCQGKTILFSGVSGAGKSTLSEIWEKENKAAVITDERVILKNSGAGICAFGTPWHGTAGIHQNIGAPVRMIYFIKHGEVNNAVRLTVQEAANRLLVRCFPTFWHRKGMEFALDFCIKVAKEIVCYELEFVPDLSVTEYCMKHFEIIS